MARTKFQRHLDKRQACLSAVDTAYDYITAYHLTAGELFDRRKECKNRAGYATLPQYMQAYVQGYEEARWRYLYADHLEWRIYHPDYGHISGKDEVTRSTPGFWQGVDADKGAHFWKGTDKQF